MFFIMSSANLFCIYINCYIDTGDFLCRLHVILTFLFYFLGGFQDVGYFYFFILLGGVFRM